MISARGANVLLCLVCREATVWLLWVSGAVGDNDADVGSVKKLLPRVEPRCARELCAIFRVLVLGSVRLEAAFAIVDSVSLVFTLDAQKKLVSLPSFGSCETDGSVGHKKINKASNSSSLRGAPSAEKRDRHTYMTTKTPSSPSSLPDAENAGKSPADELSAPLPLLLNASGSGATLLLPSDVTPERMERVVYKGGVSLAGRVVSVRYYSMRSKRDNNKRTQVILVDGRRDVANASIQVIFMNTCPDASRLLGQVVQIGPVDIREQINNATNTRYVAYARVYGATPTAITVANSNVVLEHAALRAAARATFTPAFARLAAAPLDANVNAAVLIDDVCVKENGDICCAVHDADGTAAQLLVSAPPSHCKDDENDVYNLDARPLLLENPNGAVGQVALLLDFAVHFQLDGGPVQKQLKSMAQSRVRLGTKDAELRTRLEQRSPSTTSSSSSSLTVAEAARTLPDVSSLRFCPRDGQTRTVFGTIDEVRSYGNDFTRVRCSANYKHARFEEAEVDDEEEHSGTGREDGMTRHGGGAKARKLVCNECGLFGTSAVVRVFDVSTVFRDDKDSDFGSTVLKWSNKAAASLVGCASADDFVRAFPSEEKRRERLAQCVGKTVAVSVWCKDDGMQLVLNAGVLVDEDPRRDIKNANVEGDDIVGNADAEVVPPPKKQKMSAMLMDM